MRIAARIAQLTIERRRHVPPIAKRSAKEKMRREAIKSLETRSPAVFGTNRTWLLALIMGACLASVAGAQTGREIARQASPSVVLILAEGRDKKSVALGSGFFIAEDIVATNSHVVRGAARLYAKLSGRKGLHPFEAVIANDRQKDLALLRIRSAKGSPLSIGSEDEVRVGDQIYVVGNPEGLESTFSSGNISGIRRMKGMDYLQISAPVSHGSSGGPVLDKSGGVIGVVVGSFVKGQNLNFAVPVAYLLPLASVTGVRVNHIDASEWEVVEEDDSAGKATSLISSSLEEIEARAASILQSANLPKPVTDPETEKKLQNARGAVLREPSSAEAQYELGQVRSESRRFNEAREAYDRAIRIKPDYLEVYLSKAEMYRSLGSGFNDLNAREEDDCLSLAIYSFKQGIRFQPDSLDAHVGLGKAYDALERQEEARSEFRVAIKLNPHSPEGYYALGNHYCWRSAIVALTPDELAEAVGAFKEAIRIAPDHVPYYLRLGLTLHRARRYEDSIVAYLKGIRIYHQPGPYGPGAGPFGEIYLYLNDVYIESQRALEGCTTYRALIAEGLNNGWPHFALGSLYVHLGNKAAALEEYKILKSRFKVSTFAETLFEMIYR